MVTAMQCFGSGSRSKLDPCQPLCGSGSVRIWIHTRKSRINQIKMEDKNSQFIDSRTKNFFRCNYFRGSVTFFMRSIFIRNKTYTVRLVQVRGSQVRLYQVRLGQVRLGQIRLEGRGMLGYLWSSNMVRTVKFLIPGT